MCANAAWHVRFLRLPRDGTFFTPSQRLHAASDSPALRAAGSAGVRSNFMATMTKTPQRDLHGYIADTCERADVRKGSPLPLGIRETAAGLILQFSAGTPAAFGWSCSTIQKTRRQPG